MRSVCVRCGAEKELPLGRCPGCAHVPHRGEAALSLLASSRMLAAAELDEVQRRIQRGEPLRPSAERLRAAEALVKGGEPEPPPMRPAELIGLGVASLLLSPLVPLAAAVAWRDTARGRQALVVAVASSALVAFAWAALLFAPMPASA